MVDTQTLTATPLYKLQPLFKHRHGNRITLEDIRAEAADASEEFRTGLRKALADSNIDLAQPIVLAGERDGRVTVVTDHSDRARIDAALQCDPSLVNAFHRAEAAASLAARAEEVIPFQKAYALNPRSAVAQYSHLFGTRSGEGFTVSL